MTEEYSSTRLTTLASQALSDPEASAREKSLAGSVLTQARNLTPEERTTRLEDLRRIASKIENEQGMRERHEAIKVEITRLEAEEA